MATITLCPWHSRHVSCPFQHYQDNADRKGELHATRMIRSCTWCRVRGPHVLYVSRGLWTSHTDIKRIPIMGTCFGTQHRLHSERLLPLLVSSSSYRCLYSSSANLPLSVICLSIRSSSSLYSLYSPFSFIDVLWHIHPIVRHYHGNAYSNNRAQSTRHLCECLLWISASLCSSLWFHSLS